ncbi:MAG: hypothetical protein MJZ37_09120 [Bacilli bacterium]|nr:hypothetical protein [Bacilli bacterium]
MNQISKYIVELYNYMLNIRDTMELVMPREHAIGGYEARKKVLVDGIKEGYALGNFLRNNGEKGEELNKKFSEFVDAYYSENSSVVKVAGDQIRVDSSQNFKILCDVVSPVETLKDILGQYLVVATQNNELDPNVRTLLVLDDRMYRIVFFMLMIREYEKSFVEFNKVMGESQGKPTPQSNFIVANELAVMTRMMRDVRVHNKFTDNETLDMLDETIKVIEMTEGRRDRVGNKSFKDIFEDINRRLAESTAKIEAEWKNCFANVTASFASDMAPAAPATEEKAN